MTDNLDDMHSAVRAGGPMAASYILADLAARDARIDWASLCVAARKQTEQQLEAFLRSSSEVRSSFRVALSLGAAPEDQRRFRIALYLCAAYWMGAILSAIGVLVGALGGFEYLGFSALCGAIAALFTIVTYRNWWEERVDARSRPTLAPATPAAVSYQIASDIDIDGHLLAVITRRAPTIAHPCDGEYETLLVTLGTDEDAGTLALRYHALADELDAMRHRAAARAAPPLAAHGLNAAALPATTISLHKRAAAAQERRAVNRPLADTLTRATSPLG